MRTGLGTVYLCLGIVAGLLLAAIAVGGEPWPASSNGAPGFSPASSAAEAADTEPLSVQVRAVLELPSPTPTPTAPPTRTAEARGFDICTLTPAPGTRCKVPQPTPLPPTPLASCTEMATLTPGDWCVWPREDER